MCQLGETCCSHKLEGELRDMVVKDHTGKVRDAINSLLSSCSLDSLISEWVGGWVSGWVGGWVWSGKAAVVALTWFSTERFKTSNCCRHLMPNLKMSVGLWELPWRGHYC